MSQLPMVIEIDFDKATTLSKEEIRHFIGELEAKIKDAPQMEIPEKHYFSKGVYGREIMIPKGSLIIGKIHKHAVMNVVSSGEVSVISIDGVMRVKAPYTFVSSPGAKRVIVAHEDTVWSNFHGTTETDLEKIENEFIAESYEDLEAIENNESLKIEGASWLG